MDIEKIKKMYEVNDEQAIALDINENIALHAGAGSGKTRVLTRRFLRLLLETNCEVDDIVAITFTKKAALEMKDRILELVNDFLLKQQDDILLQKLRKIKENINLANISTFHSFCDNIVRENYYKLGLEPMYQIIEEVDTETLLTRFTEEVVEEFISKKEYEEAFETLFDLYQTDFVISGKLHSEIKKLYKKIREKAEDIDIVMENTKDNLTRYYNGQVSIDVLNKLETAELLVVNMIKTLHNKYSQFKQNENLVDFNDLEIFTLQLLERHDDVRNYLKKRYRYYLVDEFQDTNDVQLKILLNLVENDYGNIDKGRLFVVGDIKQSIYAFRGANYKVFEDITEKIKTNGLRHSLSTNYRSHNNLVGIVNDIFSSLIKNYEKLSPSGKIEGCSCFEYRFIEAKKEISNNGDGNGIKEIKRKLKKEKVTLDELKIFIEKGKNLNSNSRQDESKYIVEKIKELISKGFDYNEIAILLRSRNNLKEYEEELRKNNIPYTILGGIGYFEKQEIIDLINILKYMYKSKDEVSLLGFLRSPYVGVSDDLLIDVFKMIREGKTLKDVAKLLKNDNEVLEHICEKIEHLKDQASFYSTYKFVKMIIDELNIKEVLLATENGVQKYRNIEKFLEIVKEFDSKGIFTPFEFIDYLENLKHISQKEGEAFLDTEDSNAVKIMTIHASKGLEFEVVFVPGLDRKIEGKYNSNFIFDSFGIEDQEGKIQRYGIVLKHKFEETDNNLFEQLENKIKQDESEEEIRILYVAATRAIRFLAFSGYYKKNEKEKTFISKLLENNIDEFANRTKDFETYRKVKNNILLNENNKENIDVVINRINHKIENKTKSIISISRYLTYKECPRKYYLKYIAKIESEHLQDLLDDEYSEDEIIKSMNASLKGTIVHSILEDKAKGKVVDFNSILDELMDNDKYEILRLVKNFDVLEKELKSKISGKMLKSEMELSFRLPIPNSQMSIFGVIDRVDIYENKGRLEAYLIDYKTNKINSYDDFERIKEYYKPQLLVYSYGFQKIFKDIELKGIYLYLLDEPKLVEVKFTDEEINSIIENLCSTFEFIETHSKFDDYKTGICNGRCGFEAICL